MKKDCRKRLADLRRKERGGENSSGPSVAFSALDKEQRGIWVVDSGSTQHLTRNLEEMLEVRPLQPPEEIRVTGESTVKATYVGRVKLDCKVGNNSSTVFLENVWYVPGDGVNLLSVNSNSSRCRNVLYWQHLSHESERGHQDDGAVD
jgi:hypothetical protein